MRARILRALGTGLLGAAVAIAAWCLVFTGIELLPVAVLDRIAVTTLQTLANVFGCGGFAVGCIGGAWLCRRGRHPVLGMLAGGAFVGLTWFALVTVEPIDSIGWQSFAIPALGGFLAAFAARATPDQKAVLSTERTVLANGISRLIPRVVLALGGTLFAILLWRVPGAVAPIIATLFGFALAGTAFSQEIRIRRLKERVNQLAK